MKRIFLLIIEGHGGGSMLTCELGGGNVQFWWDRPRNANVARFDDKDKWVQAQRDIATARNVRWKVIADYEDVSADEVFEARVIEPAHTLRPLSEDPEYQKAIGATNADPIHDKPEESKGDHQVHDEAFEARVIELEQLNQSDLVDRVKELKIPGRSAFTTKEKLARAIAEREREDSK